MAHAARIICGAVSQCVKIGGRTVQPSACVRYRNKIVTVVTGGLVAVIEVCIVAVDTHLGFVSIEGFMLCRGLPVGVTAPWRRALGAVLAEVTIEADVSGPVGRLCSGSGSIRCSNSVARPWIILLISGFPNPLGTILISIIGVHWPVRIR